MKRVLGLAALFLSGGLVALLVVGVATLNRYELSPWHALRLGGEERNCVEADTLDAYRACEERLQAEADRQLAERVEAWPALSRFDPDSPTWARALDPDWNRTVEMPVESPVGGALLLHGLSDGPYSLRSTAEALHAAGYHVIVPRLPGHGLFPAALADARWRHWRKVTALAARDLRDKVGGTSPIVMIGYSNGAALAMDHVLRAIDEGGEEWVLPDRMVLLSPALAVTRFARFGALFDVLGRLPGMGSLAWNGVVPEFDPVKYNSFPVRAGYEIEALLDTVERDMERLDREARLDALPPVLTIQSVVDATVPPVASLSRLYDRIHDHRSQLVLFDANRESDMEDFLGPSAQTLLALVQPDTVFDFDATLVTNIRRDGVAGRELEAVTRHAGSTRVSREALGVSWPVGVYSLSHVAIPFRVDDPVYGTGETGGLGIGGLAVKGELGVSTVPPGLLARIRYNPFHDYLERRLLAFVKADEA